MQYPHLVTHIYKKSRTKDRVPTNLITCLRQHHCDVSPKWYESLSRQDIAYLLRDVTVLDSSLQDLLFQQRPRQSNNPEHPRPNRQLSLDKQRQWFNSPSYHPDVYFLQWYMRSDAHQQLRIYKKHFHRIAENQWIYDPTSISQHPQLSEVPLRITNPLMRQFLYDRELLITNDNFVGFLQLFNLRRDQGQSPSPSPSRSPSHSPVPASRSHSQIPASRSHSRSHSRESDIVANDPSMMPFSEFPLQLNDDEQDLGATPFDEFWVYSGPPIHDDFNALW
jgi:hypothetical protein